jgi:hypothetical protein
MISLLRCRGVAALTLALCMSASAALADSCPPPTTPRNPPNGSVTTETNVPFAWNPAGSNLTGYDLFVSKNSAAATVPCFNSPRPDCTVSLGIGHYEWWVRNYTDGCPTGTESVHFTFDLQACSTPVPPSSLTPDNGTDVSPAGTKLTWSGGSADTYDVFLEQGSTCSTTTALNGSPLQASVSSLTTSALTRGVTYAWRVRASRGSTCPAPQFSHCATFHVRPCDPPGAFALGNPADGAQNVTSPVSLSWGASGGANGYNVWSRTDSSQSFALIGTTTSTSLGAVFPLSSQVEWYVEATATGGCTTTSRHQTFTVAGCPTSAPTPLAPIGTLPAGSTITFRWNAVSGASRYRVWLAPAGGTFTSIGDTSDLTLSAHRPGGSYDWYVEALTVGCPAPRSSTSRFILPRPPNCPTSPATLTLPSPGATIPGTVTFAWTAVAGATTYEVWAASGNGAASRVTTTTATSYATDLPTGNVTWYVVTHLDGCDDLVSPSSVFTVSRPAACQETVPQLLAPADGADRLPTSIDFFWSNVAGASSYRLWVASGDGDPSVVATTTGTRANTTVQSGRGRWFVEVTFNGCPSRRSAEASFSANASQGCTTPDAPLLYAPGAVPSGIPYAIRWSPVSNASSYEVSESVAGGSPSTRTTTDVTLSYQHDVTDATRFHYRVRALSNCGASAGAFSVDSSVVVTPSPSAVSTVQSTVPFGTDAPITRTLFVPGQSIALAFSAASDRPWLTINPSGGILPPEGITLTLTADITSLDAGDNVAMVRITTASSSAGGRSGDAAAPVSSTPVSVTLATPVTSAGSSAATNGALILPAVAHFEGGALFQSDARLANTGPRPLRYQLTFTPTGTSGSKAGLSTIVQVDSGTSIALDDVLKKFFGASAAGESTFGSLQIVPLNSTTDAQPPTGVTFASSRTFAITANGTVGQFVPALPLSRFTRKSLDPTVLSTLLLPQISQSGAFRTNVGLVEAASEPAHVVLSLFDAGGSKVGTVPIDLQPGEHRQINSLITSAGNFASAVRMELDVTSSTGLVTGYASVLDQTSNDPILVDAVPLAGLGSTRYVVPGIAAIQAFGGGRWQSDVRLYNASASAQQANLIFVPEGNPSASRTVNISLAGGEVRLLDDILRGTFGLDAIGGSIVVTTASASRLTASARTYFDSGTAGTFGQYIPSITSQGGAGLGERPLQILQVEQSDRFRTNVGLVELTGNPAVAEVSVSAPELKVVATLNVPLQANEFRQLGSFLTQVGLPNTYNARISVRVISGSGRVGAYGSLIDNASGDPTYVPAQ